MSGDTKRKVTIIGASGRMGKALLELISQDPELVLAEAVEIENSPDTGKNISAVFGIPIDKKITSDKETAIRAADIIIDFSSPESGINTVQFCQAYRKALVLGTTGFSEKQSEQVKEAGKTIPVLFSPNMSLGVNLLFKITRDISSFLGKNYDIEIVEYHHNKKLDAPSGTALKFKNEILAGMNRTSGNIIYGREGHRKREPGEIGIHAVRAGDIVGDHTILFAGNGERIEIRHVAHSRSTFASGALFAAKYILKELNSKPGYYSFEDIFKSFK